MSVWMCRQMSLLGNSGQRWVLACDGLSANDPKQTFGSRNSILEEVSGQGKRYSAHSSTAPRTPAFSAADLIKPSAFTFSMNLRT